MTAPGPRRLGAGDPVAGDSSFAFGAMWRSALRNAARKPVGGDAVEPSAGRASSDVPTAPSSSRVVRDTRRDASDALEMHVSVYNLPSALTRRTPRVFVALLVEAPPEARVPTHRGSKRPGAPRGADAEASSSPTRAPRDVRRGNWIVAGCTEPTVVPANARATRFCVPVRVDGLAGPLDRGHLERLRARTKRIALALYRVPDADDADDAYVFADENLSLATRLERGLTTKRLETMEYLGETSVNLGKVLVEIAGRNRDASARDHYALTRNPARNAMLAGNETNDATNETGSSISPFKRRGSSLRKTAATPPFVDQLDNGPIGLEILAAAPLFHPPPSPRETGRVVADFLVAFPPPRIDPGGAALAAHSAYVRLCRWAGDGYQPVYSSLVCGSEEEVRVEPFLAGFPLGEGKTGEGKTRGRGPGTNALVARVPTMHVPIGCLRGGGGSTREPGCMLTLTKTKTNGSDEFSREHYPLPSPDAAWRLEVVARLADGRDALVGAAELTPRELASAGARAALGDGPAALRCDETDARDFADFDVSSPADGDARAVVLVERWAVRAGTRARPTDWGPSTRRGGTNGGSESVAETFSFFGEKIAAFLGEKANVQTREGRKGTNDDDDDDDDGELLAEKLAASAKEETKTNSRGSAFSLQKEARISWTPSDSDWSASDASESDERETRGYAPGRTPRGQLRSSETKGYLHIARRARFDASPETKPPVRSHQTETDVPSTEAKNAFSSSPARSDPRVIMTPTRALLERASLARRVGNRADDAVAVAEAGNASTSRALGLGGGDDGSGRRDKQKKGGRPKTDSEAPSARRPVAEAKFRPDPRLVAAADDAVRVAVADRLQSETRGELVESALRVRRELLKKLTGELRYLEQRSRREARAGLGVRGQHTASSAAARRKSERV